MWFFDRNRAHGDGAADMVQWGMLFFLPMSVLLMMFG